MRFWSITLNNITFIRWNLKSEYGIGITTPTIKNIDHVLAIRTNQTHYAPPAYHQIFVHTSFSAITIQDRSR